jgi:hypothetical protein
VNRNSKLPSTLVDSPTQADEQAYTFDCQVDRFHEEALSQALAREPQRYQIIGTPNKSVAGSYIRRRR